MQVISVTFPLKYIQIWQLPISAGIFEAVRIPTSTISTAMLLQT